MTSSFPAHTALDDISEILWVSDDVIKTYLVATRQTAEELLALAEDNKSTEDVT